MEYIFQMMKLIVVLAIFLGVTYIILKNAKQKRINKISPNGKIQIIDGVSIGMREEIVLFKVGTEYVLLSMSSGNMLPLQQKEIIVPQEEFEELFARENPNLALQGIKKTLKDRMVKK